VRADTDPEPDDEERDPEEDLPRMTLGEHLDELRTRLVRAAVALSVGVVVALVFYKPIFHVAVEPYREAMRELGSRGDLQALSPLDTFIEVMKLAFIVAAVATGPYILWQMWGFVAAGLYPHERRGVRVFFPVSLAFFALGVLTAFLVILPIGMRFLISFGQGLEIRNDFGVGPYLSLCLSLLFGMGLAFQLPLVLLFLQATGIVERETLARGWRLATLAAFVLAMILTPDPSPVSQILMATPLVALYGLGVYGGRFVGENRVRFRWWHAWPAIVLVGALVALFVFRRDLIGLANRLFG
jgi:sec-independent protein translocase protein TatC